MKHRKQDRRVNKTKNAITKTLLTLMEKKSVGDITVSELTEMADINRKTFYNHYSNIDAVLDELENNCVNWALAFVDDTTFASLVEDPAMLYTNIARGLQRHSEFLHLLHDSGIYSRVSNKITLSIKDAIMEKAKHEFKPEYLGRAEMLLDFITAGAVGIYDTMFSKEEPATLDEVTEFFKYIFMHSNLQLVLSDEFIK